MSTEAVLTGLTVESRALIEGYLKWSKERRDKFSQDLEFDSRSFASGRILDTTFNKREVEELLAQHLQVLTASVDAQDSHKSLSTGGFVHQVLREADKHRIPLNVNALEALGNVETQGGLQAVEQRLLSGPKSKLAPLTAVETGGDAGRQLQEANEQIRQLHAKVMRLTDEHHEAVAEKSGLQQQVYALQQQLGVSEEQTNLLAQQSAAQQGADIETVNALRSEVSLLTQDINGKLSQSSQFRNLKQLLLEKNEALRQLRAQLAIYNPEAAAAAAGSDDLLIEDDDD